MTSWTLDLVAGGPEPAAPLAPRPARLTLQPGVTSFGRVRDPNVQVVLLQSPHISAKHASITVAQDSTPVLQDSSSNGCTVFRGGSRRKVKKNRTPLAEGDQIMFGLDSEKAVDKVEYKYVLRRVSAPAAEHPATPDAAGPSPAGLDAMRRLSDPVAAQPTTPVSADLTSAGLDDATQRAAGGSQSSLDSNAASQSAMDVDASQPTLNSPAVHVATAEAGASAADASDLVEGEIAEAADEEMKEAVEDGDDDDDDDDDDESSFAERFEEAAQHLQAPGAFAAGGEATLPQPMLSVAGVEDVLAWPLPGAQARQLLEVARGAGGASACSVPPGLLTWGSAPAWEAALRGVTDKALHALGVKTPTKMELRGLHVHSAETGTGIDGGGDRGPADEGVWGTLEVELPSIHEGGALELGHEGEMVRFDHAGIAGATTCHWAAFYTASSRKLDPVTSGRRLSLRYSLRRTDDGPLLTPPSQAAASRRFERLERLWVADKHGDAPQKLVYFLDNQTSGTGWDKLEGDDRSLAEALLAAKRHGQPAFDLFLATFTLEEMKRASGEWEEEASYSSNWNVHPELEVPEVVIKAAEDMSMAAEGEIVQGDDYFAEEDEESVEGSDDSQEEDEDEDYYHYHHRRYGYGYDDDRERTKKQRRAKERHAIVIWPRRMRAQVLTIEGMLGCVPPLLWNRKSRALKSTGRVTDERNRNSAAGCSRRRSTAKVARSQATPTSQVCSSLVRNASTAGRRRCGSGCWALRSCPPSG